MENHNSTALRYATALRYDWTPREISEIYHQPFPDLIYYAQTVHRANFPSDRIQRSTLLSIKTGGCPEDCGYCPQSTRYDTGVENHSMLPNHVVIAKAKQAKDEGSTRFCMGTSWRQVNDGKEFDQVLELVQAISSIGLEVCCTLGMVTYQQAKRLKEAGCHTYNHNVDTSPEYYEKIVTTRTYQDRLDTLKNVRRAGLAVCCGGIVGMGETVEDRVRFLRQLANQNPHPQSVPINRLVRVKGLPLADSNPIGPIDFVRTMATARILMPRSMVRLSAGRMEMNDETQALCFLAGANSIFAGDKLLTTPNPDRASDTRLMKLLGMKFVEDSAKELRTS